MTHQFPSIWHLLWQLIRYAQPLYWTDTLLWLFIAGLPIVPGILIREFFNTLTNDSAFELSAWVWVVLLLATGVARIAAIVTGRITKTQHRFTMSALVRRNLLARMLDRPGAEPLTVSRTSDRTVSSGEVISFFRDDASQIEDNVVSTNEILGEGVFAAVSLLVLLRVNATITLFVFVPLSLIAVIIHRIGDRIKRFRRASREATQQVTGLMGELFSSVQAIQVAAAESAVISHLQTLCDRRRQLIVWDQLLTALLESSFENLVSLGTGAILFFAAQSLRSQTNALTVGDFALFVYFLSYVTYFFSFSGSFLALSKQSEVAFERMEGLLDCKANAIVAHHPLYLPPIIGQTPPLPSVDQLQQISSTPPNERASNVPSLSREARGNHNQVTTEPLQELVARNLTYYYPGNELTSQRSRYRGIADISLRLTRGSFTAVTGAVGAGKTTLLQVLLGLLPHQAGERYWNGQRIANPSQFFTPPRSAYTPQVPQLFSTTLRENILLGLERSEAELRQAIALATFDRDLSMMPDGLDTLVGSKGMRLSGGQLQRVAAARMFIRQPDLLVFDDLSSALDLETEQTLWSRLFQLRSSAWTPTFLVVSHRPAVLERADRILLLNNGNVQLEGTFADLPATYRK
jgi:ABC-type multidrug transport system fused ATPase/permease subunit